jgi:hypothetical protein
LALRQPPNAKVHRAARAHIDESTDTVCAAPVQPLVRLPYDGGHACRASNTWSISMRCLSTR